MWGPRETAPHSLSRCCQPRAIELLGMPELIQYHVRVETGTGAVPRFVIREPRLLREDDLIQWQGRTYRVASVSFDPDRPNLAVITVKRTSQVS